MDDVTATPSPAKRLIRRLILVIIVGAIAVLCCGGSVLGFGYLFSKTSAGGDSDGDSAEAVTDAFFADLEAGRHSAAYDRLCAPTQGQFTEAEFTAELEGRPRIRGHDIHGHEIVHDKGTVGKATVDLTLETGAVEERDILLLKESDDWKVCGEPY